MENLSLGLFSGYKASFNEGRFYLEIGVRFLENLRLEARFDDYTVLSDQPIRYKGDGLAPSPFDYFLASSVLCAAYFLRIYCLAKNIATKDIRVFQNNIIDPENRYKQKIEITLELPDSISETDAKGILRSVERCTVKKVIQQSPEFNLVLRRPDEKEISALDDFSDQLKTQTFLPGKDSALEDSIRKMSGILRDLGIKIELASWRNLVPHVWSVHIRDAASSLCYTNGKGSSKEAALCSALGEYLERISCNYFYNDYYLGQDISSESFWHYPNEKWFKPGPSDRIPDGLMDTTLLEVYNADGDLRCSHLADANFGEDKRGVLALPFTRLSDGETVYIPANLIGNLYVSNGMSSGNSIYEAQVQALSEIFERGVKKQIIENEWTLPDVPSEVLLRFPHIQEGLKSLEAAGYPVFVKDASLGGRYPVMCVALMNPKTGGAYVSFGAHPLFEVALERSLTELLQGRSFEGLGDLPPPTFNSLALREPENFVEHFIDSSGVVSWKFFSKSADFDFVDWNFSKKGASTEEENDFLLSLFKDMGKEVYLARYEDFGAKACRILVPGYSEIYPSEDLIWNNTNRALRFRKTILQLHTAKNTELKKLVEALEEDEIPHHVQVSELIGVEFEDTSVWGQLVVGELKLLIALALKKVAEAADLVAELLTFSECGQDRKLFFQAIEAALAIKIRKKLKLDDYLPAFESMFGPSLAKAAVESVFGVLRFYGLSPTSMELEGLEKHRQLVASYKKLHIARQRRRIYSAHEGNKEVQK